MASGTSAITALAGILKLERSQGCLDKAVIGGLDRFLQNNIDELRPLIGEPARYADLNPERRASWVDQALAAVGNALPDRPGARQRRPAARRRSRQRAAPAAPLTMDAPASAMRGVSGATEGRLKRLGVKTVGDLMYLLPNRHHDYTNIRKVSELEPGIDQTVHVKVWESSVTRHGPNRRSTQAVVGDASGNVRVVWYNNPYMAQNLRQGTEVFISGRVGVFRHQLSFESPDYEIGGKDTRLLHTNRLVPVYPAVDGLYQRSIRRFVRQALDAVLPTIEDPLPSDVRHRAGLLGLGNALSQAHFPDSTADVKAARYRLAFDELLTMQLATIRRKRQWQEEQTGVSINTESPVLARFLESLPFSLTGAQESVLTDILDDIAFDRPMNRMLQGDVGSGKTVVAAAALLVTAATGYQGVLMAPTEILAEQHYLSLSALLMDAVGGNRAGNTLQIQPDLFDRPVTIGLLVGSMSERLKRMTRQRIAEGEIDIVIGTHAVIQPEVDIPYLGLAVVDEQHRFGVMQRAELRDKGRRPHLLAMSATPIPRSLSLTLYGDLDMSTIDEMPPGRRRIRTRYVEPDQRAAAYEMIRAEIREGRQAFVVCPFIDESESIQTRAATKEYERLSDEVFQDMRVGLIHGRLAYSEKENVMEDFKNRDLDVLVATPVIEVGIDVPNATVMLIDGADRFGLAQLHQLRGRVGRGEHQSHCLLLADDPGQEARDRLKIVERITDGFKLADEDLRIRGPGDYMGRRQSGFAQFKVASMDDIDLIRATRLEAGRLLDADPELMREEHALLAAMADRFDSTLTEEFS